MAKRKFNGMQFVPKRAKVATMGGMNLEIPNHSGDNSAGFVKTPINPLDIVNKEYVDNVAIGSDVTLYLSDDVSDVATYFDLKPDPTGEAESSVGAVLVASDTLIKSFASVVGCGCISNLLVLTAGTYGSHVHADSDKAGSRIYAELYKRDSGGTETLLTTSDVSNLIQLAKAGYDLHFTVTEDIPWTSTDRIVVKYYGNPGVAANPTTTIYMEGDTSSRIDIKTTAFSRLHDKLANLDFASAGHTGFSSSADLTTHEADTSTHGAAEIADVATVSAEIDSDILTHKNIATAHQDAPALITTHTAISDAHHTKYTDAEAVSAVATADDYIKNTGDTMTGQLNLPQGNLLFPSLAFGNADTGIYEASDDELCIITDGTEAIRILQNGDLGIGTASPALKLDTNGRIRALNNASSTPTSGEGVEIFHNTGTRLLSIDRDTANDDLNDILYYANYHAFRTGTSLADDSEVMRIDSSGNVGIGTDSPSQKLDVRGNIEILADSPQMRIETSAGNVALLGDFGTGTDGQLLLYDEAGGTINVLLNGNDISYFNGGNVGINEISPQAKLHIDGDLRIDNEAVATGTGVSSAMGEMRTASPVSSLIVAKWLPINLDGSTYYIPAFQ